MPRARRSCLVVPAGSLRMLEKARALATDEVVVDLEDSLPPEEKNETTRAHVADALQREDWHAGIRAVRVNPVSSPWFEDDVQQLLALAGEAVDAFVVPKVESAADVHAAVDLLDRFGSSASIEVQIESARGLVDVERIASASSRTLTLIFGPGDYAASVGVMQAIGTIDGYYPGDQWHYARSRIAAAAHAYGLMPIDGPFAALNDVEGLTESARRARLLGFQGKWVIHPLQIAVVEAAFTASESEVAWARRVLEALDDAKKSGRGATQLDGTMVDEASRRAAESVLERSGR